MYKPRIKPVAVQQGWSSLWKVFFCAHHCNICVLAIWRNREARHGGSSGAKNWRSFPNHVVVTNQLGCLGWNSWKRERKGRWEKRNSHRSSSLWVQLLAPSLALGMTFLSLPSLCICLHSFTTLFCPAINLMIVLRKEIYIYNFFFGFWVSQVSSGISPLLLVLLCPAVALFEQHAYMFVKVLFLHFTVYSVLFARCKGCGGYHPSWCGLLEGGPVTQVTQNKTHAALYEGTLLGSVKLRLPQVYPSVNFILHSRVQRCLRARQICSFRRRGKKSMLTDNKVQTSVGTMISESIWESYHALL